MTLLYFGFALYVDWERSYKLENEELKVGENILGLWYEPSHLNYDLKVIVEAKHSQDDSEINKG